MSGIIVPIKTKKKKLLEAIQIEAMRIVTGTTKVYSIATGWETLEARREKQKLIIFFKMVHGICPGYLNQLVPDSVQNRSQYLLRNADNISTIHTNSILHYYYFLPSAVRTWNNISNDIRSSTSLNEFKRKLSEHMIKPPNYFNYGKRTFQVHHARLCLECSALKQHLFKKDLVESPLCICGIPETSKHFLLDCPNYHQERTEPSLNFSVSRLNPCSSATPDGQRTKIYEYLKLYINI